MPDSILLTPITTDAAASQPAGGVPRLCLKATNGQVLAAGWYRLGGQVVGGGAQAMLLALLPGDGVQSDGLDVIPLTPSGEVEGGFVFRIAAATDRISLADVLGRGASPCVAELYAAPIARDIALRAMLVSFRDGVLQWGRLAAVLLSTLRVGLSGGRTAAAKQLHLCYRERLANRQYLRATRTLERIPLQLRRGVLMPGRRVVDALTVEAPGMALAGPDRPAMSRLLLPPAALGCPLAPGWYRFRARINVTQGKVVGPRLYPDYGWGESEGTVVSLGELEADGRLDVLFVLPEPARGLRFDPSLRWAGFDVESMRLDRLGRPAAFACMLSRIRGRSKAKVLADFARDLAGKGISRATDTLFSRYRETAIRNLSGYAHWVDRYDSFLPEDIAALHARAAVLAADGPTISVLVPVYQTPERWLCKCLDSVLAQAWPKWELCIANDASPSPHVRQVLDEYAARDPRIKVVHRQANGHISAASNSALAVCGGDFVALLDHDDELRPHALLEMAEAIVRDPTLKVLYSDEDKIDEDGRRFDPYFKPDWNPDLMLGQNYLCHLSVIETGLMREVGGFREGYEGSQDHDLLLRCTERVRPQQIHHVPKVLYHWRAIEGSTALVRDAKDYASVAGARAIQDHLLRTGADAVVDELPHGHYRVRWGLGPRPPKVSLIVPTRDRVGLLRMCIDSVLERTRYPEFEIIVVDNQSVEPATFDYFAELAGEARVRVLRFDAPFNYSAINNWAVSQCDGEIIGLLNNDIEVISPDWLEEMTSHACRQEVGAVGAMLYYPDDRIQHAGVILGLGGVANHAYVGLPRGYRGHGGRARVVQGLSAVTAACLLVRRTVYETVGGLDESLRVAFNDIDFCLRIRQAGYRNLWTPFAELYHHESATRGVDDTPEKAARFRAEVELMESRWGESLYRDPAYNPNLSLSRTDSGYAFPPRTQ